MMLALILLGSAAAGVVLGFVGVYLALTRAPDIAERFPF